MKDRREDTVLEKMVDGVLVMVVQMTLESVPVIGPFFAALAIVSDVQKVKRQLRD